MLNEWIFKSIAGATKQVATDNNIPVIVEHLDVRNAEFMKAAHRAEVRVTGPFTKDFGKGFVLVEVFVNVLLTSRYDADPYQIVADSDKFHQRFLAPIGIRRWGDGDTLIDCLTASNVKTFHLGPLTETDQIKQSIVDAKYTGVLPTE